MKRIIFSLCVLLLAMTVSSQASDITHNHHEKEITRNEINISTAHMKRLIKLIIMLTDPKAQMDEKDLQKVAAYIGKSYDLNPEELKRTERSLKFIFGKIKDIFKNIFKKGGKNKAKKAVSQSDESDRRSHNQQFLGGQLKDFNSFEE